METKEFNAICERAAQEIEESERKTYELMMNAVLVLMAGGENMLGFDLANAMVEAEKQLKKEYDQQWGDSDKKGENSE